MDVDWEGPFGLAVAAWLGLSVGSFSNVLIHRLPIDGLSVLRPARSFCPSCETQLSWSENIPVLAWLWQRGRCRSCSAPIAWRYPAVELLVAALFVLLWWRAPPHDSTSLALLLVGFYLATTSVVISAIDLEHFIIPDAVTLPGIVIGLLLSVSLPGIHGAHDGFDPEAARISGLLLSASGLALGGGSLWLFGKLGNLMMRRQIEAAGVEDAMGLGDVKWMAFAGTLLGPMLVGDAILAGCFLGALVGVLWKLGARLTGRAAPAGIPFGPFLSVGILVQLFRPGAAWWLMAQLAPVPA